ncbi:MAG: ABC transporter permease [Anaerolineales bacterium]|nr:ABC transporter permease [Anaerolineales bacterium]MCB0008808.1 ABC transporter permease [Anaerolineales bacterium]MCB8962470.1 ABC transporter permease [Ardenticatenales bacterium]
MRVLRDLFHDYRFGWSFSILCLLLVIALLSFFAPYDPTMWGTFQRDLPPSTTNWLGTDSRGIDIFWTATLAVRNSLTVAVIAGLVSRLITVPVAMLAGYRGGMTDRVLMFLSDSFLVIPLFMIIILLAVLLRDLMNLFTLGLLLACFGWAWDARVIRSEILSLRERGFTQTAMLSGTGTMRLVLNEYMPFVTPLVFATLINVMSWAIGLEITLAIIGLTNLDIPTLGTMIFWALSYQAVLLGYWWWLLTPVVLSVLLFIALYWLSVSISEYLDPRSRVQRVGAN